MQSHSIIYLMLSVKCDILNSSMCYILILTYTGNCIFQNAITSALFVVMGLQRIFSTTTIIIGLFISVDYGLCDEFKCRGYDREYPSDDTGTWSWKTHILWTVIYICGLALFSAYFTILEKFIFTPVSVSLNLSSCFLLVVISVM